MFFFMNLIMDCVLEQREILVPFELSLNFECVFASLRFAFVHLYQK